MEVPTATSKSGCQEQVQATLLTNRQQIRGSHDPAMGSINLLEQLTDHREMLVCQRTQMNTQMEETLGEVWWTSRAPLHCRAGLSPSSSTGPPAQKRSCTRPCPWGVAGGSTTQGPSIINSPFSAPLSSQEKVEGGNEDAKLLNVDSCFPRPFPSRSHPGSAL